MGKVITFGEVMMRLSPPGNERFVQANTLELCYGGGEANVAIALSNWGISSSHVTCFPENDFGLSATSYLKKYDVDTKNIVFKKGRLGTYFLEKGSSIRASKVIYDRADSAFANLDPDDFNWKEIFKGATWFHWTGITPAISKSSAEACLNALKVAKSLGIKISGDITYRKNLWQYGSSAASVLQEMTSYCGIINCGISEAEEIYGISDTGHKNDYQYFTSLLMSRYSNLKYVIGTKRETLNASHNLLGGYLFNGNVLQETKIYNIEPIVDRIGGGDAFMAGIIYGSLNNYSDKEKIEFATAASVLKHTISGDALISSTGEIDQIVNGELIGRLVR